MHRNFSFVLAAMLIIGTGCVPMATQSTLSDESLDSSTDFGEEVVGVGDDDLSVEVLDEAAVEVVEPATQRIYVVHKGDTLWSIATAYYGDGQRWRDILEANSGLEPTKMRVGQQLILP